MNFAAALPGLLALSRECKWLDFAQNNDGPTAIGEYVSAPTNSAVLVGKNCAWLIWSVEDGTHCVVGTTAAPMVGGFRDGEIAYGGSDVSKKLLR